MNDNPCKIWKIRLINIGMTQTVFCKRYSINPVMLSRYIHGKSMPRDKVFKRIEKTINKLEMIDAL